LPPSRPGAGPAPSRSPPSSLSRSRSSPSADSTRCSPSFPPWPGPRARRPPAAAARLHPRGKRVMRARFWGTRGSIPVALPRAAIRDKIVAALGGGGRGRGIDTVDKARAFVDRELGLHRREHLRRRFRVRGARDRRGRVRALRSGLGRAGVRQPRARHPRGHRPHLPHLHVPRALGPHHGLPLLHACLRPRQPDPHLRRPRRPRRGLSPSARGPVVPGGLRAARSGHRVHAPGNGSRLRARRAAPSASSGSSIPATPTAIASSARARPSSTRRTPSTSGTIPARPTPSWSSSAAPTS
jgi:hypothetical protein